MLRLFHITPFSVAFYEWRSFLRSRSGAYMNTHTHGHCLLPYVLDRQALMLRISGTFTTLSYFHFFFQYLALWGNVFSIYAEAICFYCMCTDIRQRYLQ